MKCYKCAEPIPQLGVGGKIGFRASCDKCLADLHCCKNCTFYVPGKPNDCMVPGTEFVSDREKNNLCEEFSFGARNDANSVKKEDAIKRFNDLFKNE